MMGKGKHSRRFLFQKTIIASVILLASRIGAQDIDYTCYPQNDYGASPSCQYVANGVCDDPNHGGFGGEGCRNQDCIDCNYKCTQFNADCYGCLNAKGCYYCPGDGTCYNSNLYTSSNKISSCQSGGDYLSSLLQHSADECIADNAFTQDPLYEGNRWMYEMINVVEVWENYGLTGKGVTIRINDDGVYVDNREFENRFDDVANSCTYYLPEGNSNHGTSVAGIVLGNANNDHCAVGIAHEAKFSSCNFFTENGLDLSNSMLHKYESFDISQNSIGLPACKGSEYTPQNNIIHDTGCPFVYNSKFDPCGVCNGQFTATDRALSSACVDAISEHCKGFYKKDIDACQDFPEIVVGGDCNYDKLPQSAVTSLEIGVNQGRNGKGIIFSFSSGNSFTEGEDVNFSGWTNSRFIISVGSVGKDGFHSDFSTPGAALMLVAPSGTNHDIGHLMTAGVGEDVCSDSGQGTSFASPVVSGVIALMLEANPDLSWRDVQAILAVTSTDVRDDSEDNTQVVNGAGIWHSNWYGFGIVNAKAAVEAAMTWQLFTEELQAIGMSAEENAVLSDNDQNEFVSTIQLNPTDDGYPEDFVSESTVVLLDLSHYSRGDLEIELVSPFQTRSILHPGRRPEDNQLTDDQRWKLMTVRNWGENPTGEWKLHIRDLVNREDTGDSNVFRGWKIIVYGRSLSGDDGFGVGSSPTSSPVDDTSYSPTSVPTKLPTKVPTKVPTKRPTHFPTSLPTKLPTNSPNAAPTDSSTKIPTTVPTMPPTNLPTEEPTHSPTKTPTKNPTRLPTNSPTKKPTDSPTKIPTKIPTRLPTNVPTKIPTHLPTKTPTKIPTVQPTNLPTKIPTESPTKTPTKLPTRLPSNPPTKMPTRRPTKRPTEKPTASPTGNATSSPPTNVRTEKPVNTNNPTKSPSLSPTLFPTNVPTRLPTMNPTKNPTKKPTNFPTSAPTKNPTSSPTRKPSPSGRIEKPTDSPTKDPTKAPTRTPSNAPTNLLTQNFSPFDQSNTTDLSCEFARPVQNFSEPVDGTLSSSPLAGLEGTCLSGLETSGGWYQVIGNGNVFSLTACSLEESQNLGISVFTGDCSKLDCIEHHTQQLMDHDSGNCHAISFTTKSGRIYKVLVSGLPFGAVRSSSSHDLTNDSLVGSFERRRLRPKLESDFWITFSETEAPQNSKCGSALPVEFGNSVEGSTLGLLTTYATCEDTTKSGAWYTVEGMDPTEDGGVVYHANTCNLKSNFYSTLSIYQGSRCGSHKCVNVEVLPCSDGSPGQQVFWSATSKENYQIFVHSADTIQASNYSAGFFHMIVEYSNRLPNDRCVDALEVELNQTSAVKGRTSGSIPDMMSIDNSLCGTGGSGAWYHIVGTGAVFQASTCSDETNHNTRIQIYSGLCDGLSCIDSIGANKALCKDGKASVVNFKTQMGVDYYILVTSRDGKTGNFGLQVTEIEPSENNQCDAAIALNDSAVLGSTLEATVDFDPGDYCGVPLDNPGVWYEIMGTGGGMKITSCQDKIFDSAISIFEGSCDGLICVTGSAATDPECEGVAVSFFGEANTKYIVYVHGKSDSLAKMGDFTVSHTEFNIFKPNAFCSSAFPIPTDGSTIQGSTENATHTSVPSSSCGTRIRNPGLWYSFPGNGLPFEISACSRDNSDFDVSVSVFAGGSGGCGSLTCVTGKTFTRSFCSNVQESRNLNEDLVSTFSFVTQNDLDYYIFVHGTGGQGVGDFDFFVRSIDRTASLTQIPTVSPTASPTEKPTISPTASPTSSPTKVRYGKDMHRWVPVNGDVLSIPTDYFELDFIDPPKGNATIQGYIINYAPPQNFTGDDIMTVNGCNEGECYRFVLTVNVKGEKLYPNLPGNEGWNKQLLWLLLLILIPCICFPLYMFYRDKYDSNFDNNNSNESNTFNDDLVYQEEKTSLFPEGESDSNMDLWDPSDVERDEGHYESESSSSRAEDDDSYEDASMSDGIHVGDSLSDDIYEEYSTSDDDFQNDPGPDGVNDGLNN